MTGSPAEREHGRLEELRRELPGAVARLAEFTADNPVQVALLAAGTIVLTAAARNIVKPKTLLEVIALQAVLTAAAPVITVQAVRRGWLAFNVRGADGALITYRPGTET